MTFRNLAARTHTRAAILAGAVAFSSGVGSLEAQQTENPLAFLEPLMGEWSPDAPDSVLRRMPELRDLIAHRYQWILGRMAVGLLENYPTGRPEAADLIGQIYWDPATERVEFIAVAGREQGEGRLFRGEYTPLTDGRIERVYDVYYRTAADTPAEELGGLRRRYREVLTVRSDETAHMTLEWWHDGRWQPWARGEYVMKRVR